MEHISTLGVDGVDTSSKEDSQSALEIVDKAQSQVAAYRANLERCKTDFSQLLKT